MVVAQVNEVNSPFGLHIFKIFSWINLYSTFLPRTLTIRKRLPPWLKNYPFLFFPINVDHKGTIRKALVMDLLLIFFPLVWFKAFRLRFRDLKIVWALVLYLHENITKGQWLITVSLLFALLASFDKQVEWASKRGAYLRYFWRPVRIRAPEQAFWTNQEGL